MIAYKGLHGDLTCTKGEGVFQYVIGETIKAERSQCESTGLHCTEYPLECFFWYPPGRGNRYFEVEASGSLDECRDDAKIACTEMTLVKELTVFQMAAKGMMYMAEHPLRPWEINCLGVRAVKDRGNGEKSGYIAIARGENPMVKGVSGAILGLMKEDPKGHIIDAKVFAVKGNIRPDTWYALDNRTLREA